MAKSFNQLLKEAKQRLNREQMSHKRSSTQTENYEDVRRRFLPNLAQGSAAGLLGAPVDIVNAALQPFTGATKPVMGSDWLGEQLGANIDDTAFILGQFIDPLSTSASLTKLAPLAAAGIIKRKGGNWTPNSDVGMLGSHRFNTPEEARHMFENPGYYETFKESFQRDQALNRWLDGPFMKYVKNRMGTESDEVRKLAEEGITHADFSQEWVPSDLSVKRQLAGVPTKNLGQSQEAQDWEDLVDYNIDVRHARDYVDDPILDTLHTLKDPNYEPRYSMGTGLRRAILNGELTDEVIANSIKNFENVIKEPNQYGPHGMGYIPELAIKDPEALVYDLPDELPYNLRFNHLYDELENALRPDSGLPDNLRLTPEGLGGLSMEEALRKVHGINQFRAEKAKKANARFAAAEGIPVYKEYPEGYRWLEYKIPDNSPENVSYMEEHEKLADWLKSEGDTMGHCVGGYCDRVMSGDTRILSLRDDEGKSVATVELRKDPSPHVQDILDEGMMPNELLNEFVKDYGPGGIGWGAEIRNDPRYQEFLKTIPEKWSIYQIKGAGNRKPPKAAIPFIQDFVRSTNYPVVGDLEYTDLIDMSDFSGNQIQGLMTKDEAIAAVRALENDPEWIKTQQRTAEHYGWNSDKPSLQNWIDHLETYLHEDN